MSDWTIDGINLPLNPITTRCAGTIVTEEGPLPGDLPLIVSIGKKAKKLTIEGWIWVSGQDKAYLETNYILPLDAKLHTEVTIAAPDTRYDGNWIMSKFESEEGIHRSNVAFYYEMEFLKGSQHVVL